MAEQFEGSQAGFKDTKTRSVLIIIIVILAVAVMIGYFSLRKAVESAQQPQGSVPQTPAIQSIPGVGDPSRQYVKLQQQQNVQLAQQAQRTGGSAIPTLTRSTYLGNGDLSSSGTGATSTGCSIQALTKARAAGVSAFELRCRGCDAAALKAAGYTAGELRDAGFTAKQLKDAGFTAAQLRAAGFSARSLKDAGFTAQQLKDAGFSAKALKDAGFSAADLKNAGFSAAQLLNAGFTPDEVKAAGFSAAEMAAAGNVTPIDCSVETLQSDHAKGLSAATLKDCGAAALKAAGYSAKDLKDAGFTAGQLRDAGFTAQQLKAAGFTAQQLHDAGFSAADLKNAGFTPDELKAAGYTDGDLMRAGFTPAQVFGRQTAAATAQHGLSGTTSAHQAGAVAGARGQAAGAQASLASLRSQAGLTSSRQRSVQDILAKINADQAKEMSKQDWQDKKTQLQQNMMAQAGDLFSTWTPLPGQQYVIGQKPKVDANAGNGSNGNGGSAITGPVHTYKAGTIFFAVLETGINSDQKSPILAKIVSGKLKGTKLMGAFARQGQRVVVQFTRMSVPYMDKSVAVNAYAIDPYTARTAMATSVDNHYLLRYGTLFASAFAEGLGSAIQNSGSSTVISDFSIRQVYTNLNTTEKALVAMGKVGQRFGQALEKYIDTPPTVKVAAGSGLGLLIMTDLQVPKKQ